MFNLIWGLLIDAVTKPNHVLLNDWMTVNNWKEEHFELSVPIASRERRVCDGADDKLKVTKKCVWDWMIQSLNLYICILTRLWVTEITQRRVIVNNELESCLGLI
jgi:hypothetical protein